MTAYRDDFAKIKIPVLSISGYFEDNVPTLYYFTEHYKYNPHAEHYLVMGPYDHFGAQRSRKPEVVDNYRIDPVAQFDTAELTYQWFDYVLRNGKKPALLADKVNYEVMGENRWRHAASLQGMSNSTLTLYLNNMTAGERYRLDASKPTKRGFVEQRVDFADRTTQLNLYPNSLIQNTLDTGDALAFVSAPMDSPFSIAGRITATIKAAINKRDMDLSLAFYVITPEGQYIYLTSTLGRASFAEDMSVRRLLTPGQVTAIPVERTALVSRQIAPGSRLLALLTVNKNSFAQINYGTGKDVSDESIEDAREPLQVRWYNDSSVQFPIWRSGREASKGAAQSREGPKTN
jgi:uncharacterized protein